MPKELTIITPLSKYLAMALFIILPFIGFSLGIRYQQLMNFYQEELTKPIPPIKSQTNTTVDNATNWKTYANEELKFSFKYPAEAILYEGKLASVDGQFVSYPNSVQLSIPETCGFDNSLFTVVVGKTQNDPKGFGSPNVFDPDIETEKILIDRVEAIRSKDPVPGLIGANQIGIKRNGLYYLIKDACESETVSQMLSTFKFLEQDENQVACTQDAKLCPDGSYVGRTGPNCEFAACPAQ